MTKRKLTSVNRNLNASRRWAPFATAGALGCIFSVIAAMVWTNHSYEQHRFNLSTHHRGVAAPNSLTPSLNNGASVVAASPNDDENLGAVDTPSIIPTTTTQPSIAPKFSTSLAPTSATAPASSPSPIHRVSSTSANQMIVVSVASQRSSDATLSAYRWNGETWQKELGPYDAYIGENGLTSHPAEGDLYTPLGQYNITTVFGSAPNPGAQFSYRTPTSNDWWIDDPESLLYNTWETGPSKGRWRSGEQLSDYEYAIAFDFNQNPVVPNGSSAIFLHTGDGSTAGCIATSEDAMKELIRWLQPQSRPIINIGVDAGTIKHS